jgi:hypothetical protein
VLDNYEACSLETIKNSLKKYEQMKMIQISYPRKKEVKITVLFSGDKLTALEGHLKNFLKNIYRTAMTSPIEQAKTTGIKLDYLAKL